MNPRTFVVTFADELPGYSRNPVDCRQRDVCREVSWGCRMNLSSVLGATFAEEFPGVAA